MTAFKEFLIGGYVLRFWPSDNGWMCGITPQMMEALEQQASVANHYVDGGRIIYPPPQRTWVGLTDEEIFDVWLSETPAPDKIFYQKLCRSIEAKLKEKNT